MKDYVEIKGSKSEAQRVVLLASVFGARIHRLPDCEDVQAALRFAQAMGAVCTGDVWVPGGTASCKADVGASATCLRMGIPLMLAAHGRASLSYEKQLASRPLDTLFQFLEAQKVSVVRRPTQILCEGWLHAGDYQIKGGVSSQYLSGLLMALAAKRAKSSICFQDIPSFEYVRMTMDTLAAFGVEVRKKENRLWINAENAHSAEFVISSDWSSVAPFIAARALGHRVELRGEFRQNQPDCRFLDVLRQMGYAVQGINEIEPQELSPVQIDCGLIPDIVPFIALVLTQVEGESCLSQVGRLKYKECDRLHATVQLLRRLGADIRCDADNIYIRGRKTIWEGRALAQTYGDHRMVMLAAIAQLNCKRRLTIQDKMAVCKSYPDFWQDYEKIEVNHEYLG